jgi:crossover junction endodeoxyribonuclease RuvC
MKPAADSASVRVLGIDPGSRCTGWGLLSGDASRPRLVDCGALRLTGGDNAFPARLARLHDELQRIVERHAPTCAAVETPFHGLNARSALQLAHARGVILAVLAGAGIPVAEYTPATVKKAVTGSGRADKAQVQAMTGRLLSAREPIGSADVADALAVALCHLCSDATRSAIERAVATGRAPGPARRSRGAARRDRVPRGKP